MGRARITIVLWVLGLSAAAHATEEPVRADTADEDARREMCQQTACQHNVRIVLKQRDGSTFDRTFDVLPGAVQPFGLVVLAGQSLKVEADLEGDRLTHLRLVEQVAHPEKTLVVELEQLASGGMMLTVNNPFKRMLKFDMGMMPLDKEDLFKTSSCPVMAAGSGFESWPYPIFQIVLGNGRLIDAKEGQISCK
jgi:hypothetical protein